MGRRYIDHDSVSSWCGEGPDGHVHKWDMMLLVGTGSFHDGVMVYTFLVVVDHNVVVVSGVGMGNVVRDVQKCSVWVMVNIPSVFVQPHPSSGACSCLCQLG